MIGFGDAPVTSWVDRWDKGVTGFPPSRRPLMLHFQAVFLESCFRGALLSSWSNSDCSLPVRTSLNFPSWQSRIRLSVPYLSNLFSPLSSRSITPGSWLHIHTQYFSYLHSSVYSPSMFFVKMLSFFYFIFPTSLKYTHFLLLYFALTTCNAHLLMFCVQIDVL